MNRPAGKPAVALAQGAYFLVTGIWPLVSMRSFQKITGPKIDTWLVNTVGVLVSVVGAVLVKAGLERGAAGSLPVEIELLGVGSAAGLGGIDVVYVLKRRIRPVYLLDAAAEAVILLAWWLVGGRRAA